MRIEENSLNRTNTYPEDAEDDESDIGGVVDASDVEDVEDDVVDAGDVTGRGASELEVERGRVVDDDGSEAEAVGVVMVRDGSEGVDDGPDGEEVVSGDEERVFEDVSNVEEDMEVKRKEKLGSSFSVQRVVELT